MKIYVGDGVYELGYHGILRFDQRETFHVTPRIDGLEIYIAGQPVPSGQLPKEVERGARKICSKCGE